LRARKCAEDVLTVMEEVRDIIGYDIESAKI
jgi:hypothetical protein